MEVRTPVAGRNCNPRNPAVGVIQAEKIAAAAGSVLSAAGAAKAFKQAV